MQVFGIRNIRMARVGACRQVLFAVNKHPLALLILPKRVELHADCGVVTTIGPLIVGIRGGIHGLYFFH